MKNHNFEASEGSESYGDEWNLSYGRKITEDISALVKYAAFDADDDSTAYADTDKLWIMVTANF